MESDISLATLINKNLSMANLHKANLWMTDLGDTDQKDADLKKVGYDKDTKWPDSWDKERLDDVEAV